MTHYEYFGLCVMCTDEIEIKISLEHVVGNVFVGYPFGKKGWRVYDLDKNEFLVPRDISFVEDVFPFAQRREKNVEISALTGGPDDDWIINEVEFGRGSIPVLSETVYGGDVDEVITPEQSIPEVQGIMVEQSVADNVLTEQATSKETEPEMDRGCREKIPSTRLRDFVNYNACCLEEKPHHVRSHHHWFHLKISHR